jgi:phosphoribosylformylglycinamidine synthase
MSAFEVMLSESQERMLVLVRRGDESAIKEHFARWDLHAAVVGHVTADGTIRVRDGEEVVAELPIALLTDDVPAYDLQPQRPPPVEVRPSAPAPGAHLDVRPPRVDLGQALLGLLASPNLRSRRFAFRQYDSTVQGDTVLGPGHAAAVVRVEGTRKGLAMATDCNPRFMRIDPRRGAAQAVAEAARNIACVGAEPIAVTDCLNFGNPEKAGVAWQLTEAVHGLAEACRDFGIPIVSGNVSLYNETAGRSIPPTPTVGMVGLLEDVSLTVPTAFYEPCAVILLGEPATALSAGEYAGDGPFPRFDLASELRLAQLLRALAHSRLLRSAQDVSDGGLAVAIAECVLLGGTGATLHVSGSPEVGLFSEDQGRAVVTCAPENVEAVLGLARDGAVAATVIGRTGGDRLRIADALDLSIESLRSAWDPQP